VLNTKKSSWLVFLVIGSFLAFLTACGDRDTSTQAAKRRLDSIPLSLPDLEGRSLDPFQIATNTKAIAFFFINTDCPISNRYAPEIQRIAAEFNTNGVNFWLVYADPDTSVEAIRKHTNEYRYSIPVLRDPRHTLVKRSQVVVTPEAAVFLATGRLLYSGRIDNRYLDFGKERPAPTKRDLQEVLRGLLRGDRIPNLRQPAVGCSISSP
jgi:peroxiredoxin